MTDTEMTTIEELIKIGSLQFEKDNSSTPSAKEAVSTFRSRHPELGPGVIYEDDWEEIEIAASAQFTKSFKAVKKEEVKVKPVVEESKPDKRKKKDTVRVTATPTAQAAKNSAKAAADKILNKDIELPDMRG